ncbi:MAG: phosphoglycerate kinase [Alphaproteobacteria bacterium]|nr:phosphoglycerate kinase [Alphaproteobacteria bacterium]
MATPQGKSFKTLDDLKVLGKRVLVRADLNVPMKDGKVTDKTRIERTADTLRELSRNGAKVILIAHFERPKGKRVPEYSLAPVARAVGDVLGRTVTFVSDCIGPDAERLVGKMQNGDVMVLENLRYHNGEEENDPAFARALAKLGDIYVNDAFSVSHRAHASVEAIAKLLPAVAGRSMEAELAALDKALANPARPVAAAVGGAKVSTKLELLGNLIKRVNVLVIGGGMANTFLLARGAQVGKSLAEPSLVETAKTIDADARKAGCEIMLPDDVVVAKEFKAGAPSQTVSVNSVPADSVILDVGPKAAQAIVAKLGTAKTIVWNGPLGAFEIPPFDAATNTVARAVAKMCQDGKVLGVAGGGDTVAALAHAGVVDQFTYVSTAGGAFLEWLEGKELPGVAALSKAKKTA